MINSFRGNIIKLRKTKKEINTMFNTKFNKVDVDIKNSKIQLPDGSILTEEICSDICLAYERMCTAQHLMDCYNVKTYKRAWKLADEIREQMDNYGMTEEEAIAEIF